MGALGEQQLNHHVIAYLGRQRVASWTESHRRKRRQAEYLRPNAYVYCLDIDIDYDVDNNHLAMRFFGGCDWYLSWVEGVTFNQPFISFQNGNHDSHTNARFCRTQRRDSRCSDFTARNGIRGSNI